MGEVLASEPREDCGTLGDLFLDVVAGVAGDKDGGQGSARKEGREVHVESNVWRDRGVDYGYGMKKSEKPTDRELSSLGNGDILCLPRLDLYALRSALQPVSTTCKTSQRYVQSSSPPVPRTLGHRGEDQQCAEPGQGIATTKPDPRGGTPA